MRTFGIALIVLGLILIAWSLLRSHHQPQPSLIVTTPTTAITLI